MRDFMIKFNELMTRSSKLEEELKHPSGNDKDVNYRDAANKTLDEYHDYMENPFDGKRDQATIEVVFWAIIKDNIKLSHREK